MRLHRNESSRTQLKGIVVVTLAAFVLGAPVAALGPELQSESSLPQPFSVSEPVKVGELEFQTMARPVWLAPDMNGCSLLELGLRITNRGKTPVRIVPHLGTPVLTTANGKALLPKEQGRNGLRRSPQPVALEPGKHLGVNEPVRLHCTGRDMCLTWMDQTGTTWSYEGLDPGDYQLALRYAHQGADGAWTGQVQTATLSVEIRHFNPSAAVVVGSLEVRALSDEVWPSPPPGRHGAIDLGFHIVNRHKSDWARLYPVIRDVRMKSSDGKLFPVVKSAALIPDKLAVPVHMPPSAGFTLADQALLTNTGRSLVLSWSDFDGNVWKVEGLRPGRYNVHLVIEGRKGKTPAEWTTWTGEIQTAALEVEISE